MKQFVSFIQIVEQLLILFLKCFFFFATCYQLTVAFASVICIVSSIEPTGWSYAAIHKLTYLNAMTPTALGPVQDVAFLPAGRVPQKANQDTMLVLGSHVRCLKELQGINT